MPVGAGLIAPQRIGCSMREGQARLAAAYLGIVEWEG